MSAPYTKYHIPYTSHGYTLIEILVVLAIVSLLFGVGYISFRDFSRREALSGVVNQVKGDLRLSQQMALSGQKPNDTLCNAPNTLTGIRFRVFTASQYYVNADCSGGIVNIKIVNLPSGVIFASPFPVPNPIEFKILGQGTNIVSGQSAAIILTQAGTNKSTTITVTSGGEIK